MAPADERPGPVSPVRPSTFAFGTTSLLIAAGCSNGCRPMPFAGLIE